jgi:predicted nucleic acid-binding protein
MALVLVSDTSVLIDLQRGQLLETALRLPYDFAVPDLLYERELRTWQGPDLRPHLAILPLASEGVALAAAFRRTDSRLSLPDAFALALAKIGGHILLAGDAALRAMAEVENVDCHGVLWMLDEIRAHDLAKQDALHAALTSISQHPRCRLPRTEVRKRLERWSLGEPLIAAGKPA